MLFTLSYYMSLCSQVRHVIPTIISARKNDAPFLNYLPFVLQGVHVLFMLFVFIYVYLCPTLFPYHMILLSFNIYTMGVTNGAGTSKPSGAPQLNASFLWGTLYSLFSFLCSVLCIIVCPFVSFSFDHFASFFYLQFVIFPVVSSHFYVSLSMNIFVMLVQFIHMYCSQHFKLFGFPIF